MHGPARGLNHHDGDTTPSGAFPTGSLSQPKPHRYKKSGHAPCVTYRRWHRFLAWFYLVRCAVPYMHGPARGLNHHDGDTTPSGAFHTGTLPQPKPHGHQQCGHAPWVTYRWFPPIPGLVLPGSKAITYLRGPSNQHGGDTTPSGAFHTGSLPQPKPHGHQQRGHAPWVTYRWFPPISGLVYLVRKQYHTFCVCVCVCVCVAFCVCVCVC
jgi:hypothetical protein